MVVVDEFHHAAASTYRRLLDHLEPHELLGLTATPERADGLLILPWFGDRIAAKLRLRDAIEQHRLVPFACYGIHDGLDLRDVPWRRGRGYEVAALSEVYTSNDAWARLVHQQLDAHVDDLSTVRCLGFCVSVEHARFMARAFEALGVAAVTLLGESSDLERAGALRNLAAGRICVIFSVDLFNEGVDIPAVDTILMLRPTESPTLFLQQLGQGLRIHARYTRIEMLAAVDEGDHARTPQWREGVYDAKSIGADLLAFTLDNTSGDFSPTTRYRDYAFSPELIHWESQSTTRADSPTGRRYQAHVAMNRSILLLRPYPPDDRAFWFLGPATYVRHEGERPMGVTSRLQTPLSGDLSPPRCCGRMSRITPNMYPAPASFTSLPTSVCATAAAITASLAAYQISCIRDLRVGAREGRPS